MDDLLVVEGLTFDDTYKVKYFKKMYHLSPPARTHWTATEFTVGHLSIRLFEKRVLNQVCSIRFRADLGPEGSITTGTNSNLTEQ